MTALKKAYLWLIDWSGCIALSILLLLMRIVWGWAFHVAGTGKLHDISRPIHFFQQLHIPAPALNAWLVAIVECVGGLLLLIGLGGRLVSIALIINMTVAYCTAHSDTLKPLFHD